VDDDGDEDGHSYDPCFEACPTFARVLAAALPLLLNLCGPSVNAFALGAWLNFQLDAIHALCTFQEAVACHTSGIGAVCGLELEHR